jgi:hypothetical protein
MQETIYVISKLRTRSFRGAIGGLICLVLIVAPSIASADPVTAVLEAKLDAAGPKLATIDAIESKLDKQVMTQEALEAATDPRTRR